MKKNIGDKIGEEKWNADLYESLDFLVLFLERVLKFVSQFHGGNRLDDVKVLAPEIR